MSTLATVLSYASGFALMRYPETPAVTLGTSLAIELALGPLTAVIAARRGRNQVLWTVLGFTLGIWSLAAVLLMGHVPGTPAERGPGPQFPPTSRAA
jgi:hypothetical protein